MPYITHRDGIAQPPFGPQPAADDLTRELREMTLQRNAAWQAQAELVEARIALRNSEAGRETAVDLAESARDQRDEWKREAIEKTDALHNLSEDGNTLRLERDAARADADLLAQVEYVTVLTNIRNEAQFWLAEWEQYGPPEKELVKGLIFEANLALNRPAPVIPLTVAAAQKHSKVLRG